VAQNIRVHQLARELGLANKDILDLCQSLGIGVKSHSSSIQEAQADRIRRRAQREGLGSTATPAVEQEAPAAGKPAAGGSTDDRPAPRVVRSGRPPEGDGDGRPVRPAAEAPRPAAPPAAAPPAARSTPPPAAPPPARSTPPPPRPPAERPAAASAERPAAPEPPAPPAGPEPPAAAEPPAPPSAPEPPASAERPAAEPAAPPAAPEQPARDEQDEDEGSDDWRTWSGRSVNP